MKGSLVAYDYGELHKKYELKIVIYGYVRAYPKKPVIHIGSLKILGVKPSIYYLQHLFVLPFLQFQFG
jgi:hypothetical protein